MPSARGPDEPNSSQGFGSITEDLRRVLRTELLRGTCSAVTVARLFSMHRRTLHRHLRIEGPRSGRSPMVRFEIACELLENTDMALSQVAAALRYSELSAFTRAFRRWSGQTPSAWRTAHRRIQKPRRLRSKRGPALPLDPDNRSVHAGKLSWQHQKQVSLIGSSTRAPGLGHAGASRSDRMLPLISARQSKTVNAMAQQVKQQGWKGPYSPLQDEHTRTWA